MKKMLIACVLLAALIAGVGISVGQEVVGNESGFLVRYDYAPEKPTEPKVFGEVPARVTVRFSGSLAAPYETGQIQAFLRRGLPVGLELNEGLVGSGTDYLTWDQVRDLQRFAEANGTTLHIVLSPDFGDPWTDHHGEIVQALSFETILRETGYRPRVLAIPDREVTKSWFRRNRDYMASVSDSLGLWYIDITGERQDSTSMAYVEPAFVNFDNYPAATSSVDPTSLTFMRPGMGITRHHLVSEVVDRGAFAVERTDWYNRLVPALGDTQQGYYSQERFTGVKPPSTSEWTLTKNAGDATALYRETWASFYTEPLTTNRGFSIVLEDSASSPGPALSEWQTGILNGVYAAGGFSPEHVAWTLAMLMAKSEIEVTGPEAWAQWVTGEFAVGTDLIRNPGMAIPQYAIGDTLGTVSEYPYIRGFGTFGAITGTHSADVGQIRPFQVEQTGDVAKYVRRTDANTADNPYYAVGDSVSGTRGRAGGVLFHADPTDDDPNAFSVVFGGLEPGARYRFSVDVKTESNINPVIREWHQAYYLKSQMINSSVEAGFSSAYRDTLVGWKWRDLNLQMDVPDVSDGIWSTMAFDFMFPEWPLGESIAADDYGSTSEVTTDNLFMPYSNDVQEGVFANVRAAWSMDMQMLGTSRISNPRLIYLGD